MCILDLMRQRRGLFALDVEVAKKYKDTPHSTTLTRKTIRAGSWKPGCSTVDGVWSMQSYVQDGVLVTEEAEVHDSRGVFQLPEEDGRWKLRLMSQPRLPRVWNKVRWLTV